VGHSYGGAVITNAAAGNPNVKALVYIDAFIPDIGESILQLTGAGSLVPTSIEFKAFPPQPDPNNVDIYLRQDKVREAFAADVPPKTAAAMAAAQRPLAVAAAGPTEATARRDIPSWALVGTQDKTITDEQLFMAHRANATIEEVKSSHVAMISHPEAVTTLIETTAKATS
jgi:pimeloyl-ACP methyl ester carboxylesterase